MVTKTELEIDEMRMSIKNGDLPADAIDKHFAAEEKNVFGEGFKRDRNGRPIEQGIGSPGHETKNHWDALRMAEKAGLEAPGTTDRLMAEAAARKKKAAGQ